MGRASRFGHAAGAYIACAVTCQQNAPARVSRQAHLRERFMRLHRQKPAAAGRRRCGLEGDRSRRALADRAAIVHIRVQLLQLRLELLGELRASRNRVGLLLRR